MTGMGLKFLSAFVFQEHQLPIPEFYNPFVQGIWAINMPVYNWSASLLGGVKDTDLSTQTGKDVYPGASQMCRTWSPHAIWHEQSANGFIDLLILVD